MASPFETIITSDVFTFRIGSDQVPMKLHKELVARHSQDLRNLMCGKMLEAHNGVADLIDIEPDTFACYAEWLYTGDYGEHERSRSYEGLEQRDSTELVPWHHMLTFKERKKKEKEMRLNGTWDDRIIEDRLDDQWAFSVRSNKKERAWEAFTQGINPRPAAPPRKSPSANQDQTTMGFLRHARLYCFADKYGISRLQELCLENLKQSLVRCDCQDEQIDEVVSLIEYTVSNTPLSEVRNISTLRSLVLDFAVIVCEKLVQHENFKELLKSDEYLAAELLLAVCQCLV